MAGEEDATALPGQVGEELADPLDALGVEPVGRLVEDERVGVTEQCRGQAESLAHAEREATDRPLGHLREPDHGQCLVNPCAGQLAGGGDRPEVVVRVAGRVGVGGVEERADLGGRMLERAVRLPLERRRPAVRAVELQEQAHRRALA